MKVQLHRSVGWLAVVNRLTFLMNNPICQMAAARPLLRLNSSQHNSTLNSSNHSSGLSNSQKISPEGWDPGSFLHPMVW